MRVGWWKKPYCGSHMAVRIMGMMVVGVGNGGMSNGDNGVSVGNGIGDGGSERK